MSSKFAGRQPVEPVSPGGDAATTDRQFESLWPALWEYLTLTQWDDGSPREPSTLLFFLDQGQWKACVNDKANGRTGWRSAATFTALLDAVEAGLAGGAMDWRRPKQGAGRRAR